MKLRCLPPADVSADSVVDVRIPPFGANRLPSAMGIQCQQSLGVLNRRPGLVTTTKVLYFFTSNIDSYERPFDPNKAVPRFHIND